MNYLRKHYNNIIIYDLLTKLNFNNIFKLPNLNIIILNIGLKNANIDKKKMITIILLLKLITNQQIFNTKSRKNNIILKIKKGSIVGCKVTLRKKNVYHFLEKLIFFILPNIRNFQGIYLLKNINILSFQFNNVLNFPELEKEFFKFKSLPSIDINFYIKNKSFKHIKILFNQFNIPLKIKSENNLIGKI
jgi:large subunit ribosomal protein L5